MKHSTPFKVQGSMFDVQRSARPLPKYITAHHSGGYDVRLKRGGVEYRAYIPPSSPPQEGSGVGSPDPALARALACVARFIEIAGAGRESNTGLRGITETVRWSHNRAYPAFSVCAPGNHRRVFRVSAYGDRRRTLRAAAAHRARMTGDRITPAQIEEALAHV